jgi:metallophosphoesterase (TIGR00282 family)
MATIRVLFIGDLVGAAGRAIFAKHIDRVRKKHAIDALIVNGENSAQGRGITPKIAQFFKEHGVDVITSGNHIWHNKEIYSYLDSHKDLLRPVNFPPEAPGVGVTTFMCKGFTVGVVNVQGRIFMRELVTCPFRAMDSILTYLKIKTNIILVDFHAEATSEKQALGLYLDGRISALVGTHTHVQTADERILPKGTAYMTDLGMGGSLNESIGMRKEAVIQQFLTQLPVRFIAATSSPFVMSGVWVEIDTTSGKAVQIERVRIVDTELQVDDDI